MVGQFAVSKAGHDKGSLYVITAEEGEYVFLCDGRTKPPGKPKKKKRKHIQPVCSTVDGGLLEKLQDGVTVRPEEIRCALKQYAREGRNDDAWGHGVPESTGNQETV